MQALRSVLKRIDAWAQLHPRAVTAGSGSACGVVGDSFAQKIEGHGHEPSRTALVSAYYAVAGITFWLPFFTYLDRVFGHTGLRAVVAKTVACNGLGVTLIDIPAFHICVLGPRLGIQPALEKLRANYSESLVCAWVVWVPTMAAVYYVIPVHLRVPAMYCVDSTGSCLLSLLGHRAETTATDGHDRG